MPSTFYLKLYWHCRSTSTPSVFLKGCPWNPLIEIKGDPAFVVDLTLVPPENLNFASPTFPWRSWARFTASLLRMPSLITCLFFSGLSTKIFSSSWELCVILVRPLAGESKLCGAPLSKLSSVRHPSVQISPEIRKKDSSSWPNLPSCSLLIWSGVLDQIRNRLL